VVSREPALRHPSDQAFTSHNTAILDVGFLLSGGPEPVEKLTVFFLEIDLA
jgi:hypothetical protein